MLLLLKFEFKNLEELLCCLENSTLHKCFSIRSHCPGHPCCCPLTIASLLVECCQLRMFSARVFSSLLPRLISDKVMVADAYYCEILWDYVSKNFSDVSPFEGLPLIMELDSDGRRLVHTLSKYDHRLGFLCTATNCYVLHWLISCWCVTVSVACTPL